jgi:hypothetical protein
MDLLIVEAMFQHVINTKCILHTYRKIDFEHFKVTKWENYCKATNLVA